MQFFNNEPKHSLYQKSHGKGIPASMLSICPSAQTTSRASTAPVRFPIRIMVVPYRFLLSYSIFSYPIHPTPFHTIPLACIPPHFCPYPLRSIIAHWLNNCSPAQDLLSCFAQPLLSRTHSNRPATSANPFRCLS